MRKRRSGDTANPSGDHQRVIAALWVIVSG
jgi:hypothetical protein